MGHFPLKFVGHFCLKAPDVSALLEETERFREHLALLACPSCAKKALKLVNYVQGPTGWGSGFFCTNCNTRGELNSDGFRVELIEAKKEPDESRTLNRKRRLKSSAYGF